jgi:hypothetical protein
MGSRMIEVSLYESDVDVLKRIAHGNALFSGGFGDRDPKVGLLLLIEQWNEQDEKIERLEKRIEELEFMLDNTNIEWRR